MEIVRCGANPHLLSGVLTAVAKTAVARHGAALLHMDAFRADFKANAISMDEVREIADNDPTPMSLQQMRTFADGSMKLRIVSAKFVHKELQSRYAHAIMELSDLPVGLSETTSVRHAINFYRYELQSINRMKSPTNVAEDLMFTEKIRSAKERGSNLVPLICCGLQELKATDLGQSALQLESVQEDIKDRLDKFFLGRIGIRMIIGHHVESLDHTGGRVHLVNAEQVVHDACERARELCIQYCGVAPPVQIRATPSANMPFMYVESHLHHMVFELVKNSMRAAVENHRPRSQLQPCGKVNLFERVMNPKSPSLDFYIPAVKDVSGVKIFPDVSKYHPGDELPPVEIVVCQGSEDLTVKVSDEGGGVPRSRWNKLWHYDYTTSPLCLPIDSDNYPTYHEHFSGGGYGLLVARLFARYFGGEVVFARKGIRFHCVHPGTPSWNEHGTGSASKEIAVVNLLASSLAASQFLPVKYQATNPSNVSMSQFVKTKVLPSGHSIPNLALGVYQSGPGAETYEAVLTALKLGYRHIDTATAYSNERDVGRAVRDSGIPRQEIFVTSKIVCYKWDYDGVKEDVCLSNRKLGLGYIDLYLLHAPYDSSTRADAWRALEDMQTEGIVCDIGVSNFGEPHLLKLAKTWRVKPAVNQVELHPWLARTDTVKFCQEHGIIMEAYSPLASAEKMNDPVIEQIASDLKATPAQVLIAWSLAKGFVPLPKSVKESRIKENLEAAQLKLSAGQMEKLNGLDSYFLTCWDPIKHHTV